MVRGTFANVRLRNKLVATEGGFARHLPTNAEMSIFDASEKYRADGTPLVILAGKEYGSGSSRDWAAKGPGLLGVRAVIAESYERIHRSNLVGMGILPLQFPAGENAESLKLTGEEIFEISGIRNVVESFAAGSHVKVKPQPRARIRLSSKRWCASILRRKPSTTPTAAFCNMYYGSCWRRRKSRWECRFWCPPLESFVSGDLFDHQETSNRILFSHQLQSFTLTTGVSPNA